MLMDNEEGYIRRVRDTIVKYASVDFSVDDNEAVNSGSLAEEEDSKESSDTTFSCDSVVSRSETNLGGAAANEDVELDADFDENASDVSIMSDL